MLVQRLPNGQPYTRLRNEMDRIFEQFFGDYEPYRAWDPGSVRRFPAVNIWKSGDEIVLEAEMPGVCEDDFEITVLGNDLTIRGERRPAELPEETIVHRRERGAGAFSRVIQLPFQIDEKGVNATLVNGVLKVTVTRAAAAQPRRVEVLAP
jgi:HSP20 family protein